MKKPISLHKQRILTFIPILNTLILFIWLYNFSCTKKEHKVFGKSLLYIFGVSVPIAFLQLFASKIFEKFPTVVTIIDVVALYMIPFSIGAILVKYQEKIIWESEKKL